jgi:mannitol/fructose-specific phosphotransferase system IIA component (Ntr-type)
VIKAPALRIDRVLLDLDASDCAGALKAIADDLASSGLARNSAAVHDALALRERTLSTALGGGIAIPHARLAGLGHPLLSFARLKRPIAMGAADGAPVDLIVTIVSPVEEPGEHVKLLASLARRLQDPACLAALREATDARAVRAAFESA